MKCTQTTCDAAALYAYEWPGHPRPCFTCREHATLVINVSHALGARVTIYPIELLAFGPLLCELCWAYLRIRGALFGDSGFAHSLSQISENCPACAAALQKRQA